MMPKARAPPAKPLLPLEGGQQHTTAPMTMAGMAQTQPQLINPQLPRTMPAMAMFFVVSSTESDFLSCTVHCCCGCCCCGGYPPGCCCGYPPCCCGGYPPCCCGG